MNYATRENVKPGTLLRATGGCTMRYHKFFQVIEVKGTRVKLGVPQCGANGNQEGEQWIEAPTVNPDYVQNAKFVGDSLKLCGKPGEKSWLGKDSEWTLSGGYGSLYIQQIGEREQYYGD